MVEKDNVKKLIDKGLSIRPITNEVSMQSIVSTISDKLDTMDTETKRYYLQDLFKDYFIYEIATKNNAFNENTTTNRELYKHNYTVDGDGVVTFTDEPQKVQRKVEYVDINKEQNINNNIVRTKGVKTMTEKKEKSCCPDVVDSLIANEMTRFTKADKEWLLSQTDVTINKLQPIEIVDKEKELETAKELVKNSLNTNEDVMGIVPDALQEPFKAGLTLHKENRTKMVTTILDNSKDVWKKEELEAMETNMLDKLSKSVQKEEKKDYSGLGANRNNGNDGNEEEILLPVGVNVERKEDK